MPYLLSASVGLVGGVVVDIDVVLSEAEDDVLSLPGLPQDVAERPHQRLLLGLRRSS